MKEYSGPPQLDFYFFIFLFHLALANINAGEKEHGDHPDVSLPRRLFTQVCSIKRRFIPVRVDFQVQTRDSCFKLSKHGSSVRYYATGLRRLHQFRCLSQCSIDVLPLLLCTCSCIMRQRSDATTASITSIRVSSSDSVAHEAEDNVPDLGEKYE